MWGWHVSTDAFVRVAVIQGMRINAGTILRIQGYARSAGDTPDRQAKTVAAWLTAKA
jgi:hypothetical protein